MFDEVLELLKDTLNGAFSRDTERQRTRKIIFWYDSKKEYEEFINELELDNTEIIKYDNNSFWIRYHIENEELVYSPYLSYYVSSTPFRKFIYPFAQGSTRFNLCKADFEKASIKLPLLENQIHIYAILNSIAEKIETEEMMLEKYLNQKQYLLRQMFI